MKHLGVVADDSGEVCHARLSLPLGFVANASRVGYASVGGIGFGFIVSRSETATVKKQRGPFSDSSEKMFFVPFMKIIIV